MSGRINIILITLFSLTVFAACNATKIPKSYLPHPNKLNETYKGSWIEVTLNQETVYIPKQEIAGELIAIQSDTMFVLSYDKLSAIKIVNLNTATLYIFKNQGGKYALITFLLILPDIIGAIAYAESGFLTIAIPSLIIGSAFTIAENLSESNRLFYPGRNVIEEFKKFARFPLGIPPGVNKSELQLILPGK